MRIAIVGLNTSRTMLSAGKEYLLRSKVGTQEKLVERICEKLRSEKVILDSKAVQKAIRDRVSEVGLTSHKSER